MIKTEFDWEVKMEKLEIIERTVQDKIHNFYCDECNKLLGSSHECDDGYYKEFGEFKLRFFASDHWYVSENHFCDKCKNKFINTVIDTLKELGFEKQ